MRVLLKGRADVNLRDSGISSDAWVVYSNLGSEPGPCEFRYDWPGSRMAALMLAAHEGELGIARLLVDAGADVDRKNGSGQTALQIPTDRETNDNQMATPGGQSGPGEKRNNDSGEKRISQVA